MNKKAKLYLLILINILAWGYVGVKVYNALQGDDDIKLNYTNSGIKKIELVNAVDSVKLVLNYPDPFLKKVTISGNKNTSYSSASKNTSVLKNNSKIVNNHNTSAKLSKVETAPKEIDIKYLGMLKNNDKGIMTAMLVVNGKSVLAKLKENIDGYLVQDINDNSITLKKGKEILTITK